MKKYQSGAALIVVLIFLVALTVIGTLAIRQSVVGLGIATNSQAQQLQVQNSDSSFFRVEDRRRLIESLSASGMFGYISNPKDRNKELVFCYRGDQSNFFDINFASIISWEPGDTAPRNNAKGTAGYCDARPSTANYFTSARRTVMTQVSVKFSTATNAAQTAFTNRTTGEDGKLSTLENAKLIKIFAVSIMPTLSSVEGGKINKCLQEHMNEVTIPDGIQLAKESPLRQNVTDCLTNLNVPFSTYVTEHILADLVK